MVELDLSMHVVKVREVRSAAGTLLAGVARMVTGAVPLIVALAPATVTARVVLVEVMLPVLRKGEVLLLLVNGADESVVTVVVAAEVVLTVLVKLPSSVPVVRMVLKDTTERAPKVLVLSVEGSVVTVAVTVCGRVVVVV